MNGSGPTSIHYDHDAVDDVTRNTIFQEPGNLGCRLLDPLNQEQIDYKKNLRVLYQEWHKMWHKQYFETGSWKRGNEGDGVAIIVASSKVRCLVEDMPRQTNRPNYLDEIEQYWRFHSAEHARLFGPLWEWVAQRSLDWDLL